MFSFRAGRSIVAARAPMRSIRAFFGISVDRSTIAVVALLKGKATPSESPQTKVVPEML
jgi:hypothetical protein